MATYKAWTVKAALAEKAAREAGTLAGRRSSLATLRSLFPDARFFWKESHGLVVFWPPGRQVPAGLFREAGFVEDLLTGEVLKDRVGGTSSMARKLVGDLDVLRVMLS